MQKCRRVTDLIALSQVPYFSNRGSVVAEGLEQTGDQ